MRYFFQMVISWKIFILDTCSFCFNDKTTMKKEQLKWTKNRGTSPLRLRKLRNFIKISKMLGFDDKYPVGHSKGKGIAKKQL